MNDGLFMFAIAMVLGGFIMGFIGGYFGDVERDDWNKRRIASLERKIINLSKENQNLKKNNTNNIDFPKVRR